jgi:hypothetical protein
MAHSFANEDSALGNGNHPGRKYIAGSNHSLIKALPPEIGGEYLLEVRLKQAK